MAAARFQPGFSSDIWMNNDDTASFGYLDLWTSNPISADAQTLTFTAGTGIYAQSMEVALVGTGSKASIEAALTGKRLDFADSTTNTATITGVNATGATPDATYTMSRVFNDTQAVYLGDGVNVQLVHINALTAGANTITLGTTGITITLNAIGPVSAEAVVADITEGMHQQIVVAGGSVTGGDFNAGDIIAQSVSTTGPANNIFDGTILTGGLGAPVTA